MMFDVNKLSTLAILGSVLLASTCVQAMDEPETLTFAEKKAIATRALQGQKPVEPKPVAQAPAVGKLVVPVALEVTQVPSEEAPQPVVAAPQGPSMQRGTPPPPPGAMVKKTKAVAAPAVLPAASADVSATPVSSVKAEDPKNAAFADLAKAASAVKLRATPKKEVAQPEAQEGQNPFGALLRSPSKVGIQSVAAPQDGQSPFGARLRSPSKVITQEVVASQEGQNLFGERVKRRAPQQAAPAPVVQAAPALVVQAPVAAPVVRALPATPRALPVPPAKS